MEEIYQDRFNIYFKIGTELLQKIQSIPLKECELLLWILWQEYLEYKQQDKFLQYKQDSRAEKYLHELFASIPFKKITLSKEGVFLWIYAQKWGLPTSEKNLFEQYYQQVHDWLIWELSDADVPNEIQKECIEAFNDFKADQDLSPIFSRLMYEVQDMEKLQKIFRAYQALENHTFYIEDGRVFSRFSYDVFSRLQEYTRSDRHGKVQFFSTIQSGYTQLIEFPKWEQKRFGEEKKELYQKYGELISDDKDFLAPKYHPEYLPILRHLYDWILRIAPDECVKMSSWDMVRATLETQEYMYTICGKIFIPAHFPSFSYYLNEYLWKKRHSLFRFWEEILDELWLNYDHIGPEMFFPLQHSPKKEEMLSEIWKEFQSRMVKGE